MGEQHQSVDRPGLATLHIILVTENCKTLTAIFIFTVSVVSSCILPMHSPSGSTSLHVRTLLYARPFILFRG